MANLVHTTGLIFNIQRFSVHDGPGIRSTLFFKGCPLHCAWCHNPESISPQPEMMLRGDFCLNCGACVAVCPQGAIAATPAGPVTHREKCSACGLCATACPVEARVKVGLKTTVAEAMQTVLADRVFFDQSGGGVSFSGGEPTRQPDFLHALLEASRNEGLHTVVDTCGYAPWPVFARIAPLTDLFLFDLKMINAQKHRHWSGVSNRRILENLTRLDVQGSAVNLRMPVIPGINDTPEDLDQMADWLATLRHVQTLHLLPFHRGGTAKYLRLDRPNPLRQTEPPDTAQIDKIAGRLRNHIKNVVIGG